MKSSRTFSIVGIAATLLVSGCLTRPSLSIESDASPGVPQLHFSDAKGDVPVVVVDGYPWRMTGTVLDVYRLPEKALIQHVSFHENPRLSENSSHEELSDRGPRFDAPFQTERTWLSGLASGKYVAELRSQDRLVRVVEFEVQAAPRTNDAAARGGMHPFAPRAEQKTRSVMAAADLPPWALRQRDLMAQTQADLEALIESSPALVARLGKVTFIAPAGGSSSTTRRDKDGGVASMNGTYRCEVHGADRTEVLLVDWVRDSEKLPVKIVRIAEENGAALSLSGG